MASRKEKALEIYHQLEILFPDAHCELDHTTPFQLAVAVLLSAQTTDVSVNKVTPALFAKYPDAFAMSQAEIGDIESYIRTLGLYRNKAKNIKEMSQRLVEVYHGEMPRTREELMTLAGIGRKSANVILSVCFDVPSLAVDTHVERVSKRLGLCPQKSTVLEVEKRVTSLLPIEYWNKAHHLLIFFGRYLCKAQRPMCDTCPLTHYCKEYPKRVNKQV
ncbi:MAG: endonuclease III [Erysipelotrichales bacterium]|nr:endonuclease III [Erysipelotrichales bacterium]